MIPNCIDLFAGCGGLSLGLHRAGFNTTIALEAHPDAFSTYHSNLIQTGLVGARWPEWLSVAPTDVVDLVMNHKKDLATLRGTVDLVAGGPPCQGFSTNGRRDPDDPRSRMVEAYLEIVSIVRPRLILLENVRGFVSMPHSDGGTYAESVNRRLSKLEYDTWSEMLLASDWGVPQSRPRFICIAAVKDSLPGINPFERLRTARRSFLSQRGLWPGQTTVREAISDFALDGQNPTPDPEWGARGFSAVELRFDLELTNYQRLMRTGSRCQPTDRRVARHSRATIERFQQILETCRPGVSLRPADRNRLRLGKRSVTPLDADQPAPTVTTLPDDFIHYTDPRTLSVREHARLQSFPDWFSFQGPYTSGGLQRRLACPRYTQVGNAVPPLLAEALGEMLLGILSDQETSQLPDVPKVCKEIGTVIYEVLHS